jgi:glycosyltransferase involved in cell wall biosynthesis
VPPPTVTVIVPAYRVAPFIGDTIASVLAQTRQDFEIVVVNDGSPDTPELRAAVAPFLDRVQYLEQENGGPSRARNRAIAAARGTWLAFLDGDDLWAPTFLDSQLRRLEADPDAVLVWCDSQPFGGSGREPTLMTSEPPSGECDVAALLSGRCVVFTSTTVARRDAVLDAGGFDETLHRCEDFDLWLRLATRGRLLYSRELLGRRRLHPTSQSASAAAMLRSQVDVRRRFVAATPLAPEVRAVADAADRRCEAHIALADGHRLLAAGDAAAARRELARAAGELPSLKLRATLRLLSIAPGVAVALQRWRTGSPAAPAAAPHPGP